MNLLLHQLRKDLRQFQVAVIVWLALLAADLAANLGWIGKVRCDPKHGLDLSAAVWSDWLPGLLGVLLLLLPALVVLADSPAKTDGFLATRPMPKRALYGAKALFVVLVIMLPPVLLEGLHLALRGVPVEYLLQGTAERLVFLAPAALLVAAFAGLWAHFKEFWVGLAVVVAGAWGLALLLVTTAEFVFKDGQHWNVNGPTTFTFLAWLWFVAAGTVILAWLNHHGRWRWLGRGLALGGMVLASLFILVLWSGDFFSPQPVYPVWGTALEAPARFQIPSRGLYVQWQSQAKPGALPQLNLSLRPRLESLPEDWVVEWKPREVTLVRTADSAILGRIHKVLPPVFSWISGPAMEDLRAISHWLPPNTLLLTGQGSVYENTSVSLGTIPVADPARLLQDPIRLQTAIQGRLFRWEKTAELAPRAGETANDEAGTWSIVGRHSRYTQNGIVLHRRQIMLATSRQSLTARSRAWPADQYVFVLFHPRKAVAQFQEWHSLPRITQGAHTAYARFYLELYYLPNEQMGFACGDAELAQARLLIFRKTFLGTIEKSWSVPSLVLGNFRAPTPVRQAIQNEQLTGEQWRRRLAALSPPEPQSSRLEVGRYLTEVLHLQAASGQRLESDDPVARHLAALVPRHLAVFLEGVPLTEYPIRGTLLTAITQGAEESQKGDIINALPRCPELAEVLLARGWVAEARSILESLLNQPQALPYAALQALAWLESPQTYPRLLDELEAAPSLHLYELLRILPGIEPGLDQTVARIWRGRRRGTQDLYVSNAAFDVTLRHGRRDAFDEIYRRFSFWPPATRSTAWHLLEALKRNLVLHGLSPDQYHDHKQVAAWLAQHRPDEFRFDPIRRRFVLINPGKTTNNP